MWYEDEEVKVIAQKCDSAIDDKDSSLLLELSEECERLGKDYSKSIMIRAYYFYNSFTSLSNYYDLEVKSLDSIDVEKITERSLFLSRTSLNLMDQYFQEGVMEALEKQHFYGLYYQTKVNYCNLLVNIGRYPNAIYNMRKIAKKKFGMAIGNLGLEVFDYARLDYDITHQQLLLEKAASLLKEAINYSDSDVHPSAKSIFHETLLNITDEDSHEEILNALPSIDFLETNNSNFRFDEEEVTEEEFEYRRWTVDNALMLNTVNDVDYSYDFSHDSIHLPSMIVAIDKYHSTLHGLFNQIKQEYSSARFMLYEGIFASDTHFSDKEVFLVNTLDYPKYGLNIEKTKSAYRVAYSLFDRIAYFLDKYYELGYKPHQISFKKVWNDKSKLLEYAKTNPSLKALHWINKDLYKSSISEYEDYIDPTLRKTNIIRNTMEHRYLKILDSVIVGEAKESTYDNFADVITTEQFYDLGVNLVRTCREAIILLCMAVNLEEKNKAKELDNDTIPPISFSSYEDNWKR